MRSRTTFASSSCDASDSDQPFDDDARDTDCLQRNQPPQEDLGRQQAISYGDAEQDPAFFTTLAVKPGFTRSCMARGSLYSTVG